MKKQNKIKNKKEYDENDLISFGQYLLSKDRLEKIKAHEQDDVRAMEIFHHVTDASFCNWKEGKLNSNEYI